MRVGEKEEVTCEAATTALRKAVWLNRAIQASDGHWAAENAGPMFFTPPLRANGSIMGCVTGMDDVLLLLCTYEQTNVVVRLHHAMTFAQVVDAICGNFDDLVRDAVYMLRDVPGYKKFKVDSDDNIRNMLCLAKSFELNHLDILIQIQDCSDGCPNMRWLEWLEIHLASRPVGHLAKRLIVAVDKGDNHGRQSFTRLSVSGKTCVGIAFVRSWVSSVVLPLVVFVAPENFSIDIFGCIVAFSEFARVPEGARSTSECQGGSRSFPSWKGQGRTCGGPGLRGVARAGDQAVRAGVRSSEGIYARARV
ncbi:hypothetical protein CsSME_00030127 [Camellia sinensis var. sinensis]